MVVARTGQEDGVAGTGVASGAVSVAATAMVVGAGAAAGAGDGVVLVGDGAGASDGDGAWAGGVLVGAGDGVGIHSGHGRPMRTARGGMTITPTPTRTSIPTVDFRNLQIRPHFQQVPEVGFSFQRATVERADSLTTFSEQQVVNQPCRAYVGGNGDQGAIRDG